jgi:hypothetical protein
MEPDLCVLSICDSLVEVEARWLLESVAAVVMSVQRAGVSVGDLS